MTLFMASNRPFGALFDLATIDPSTAYYRLYIWNSVGPYVLDSPWFGVYAPDVEYQGSVDSLWLVLAGSYGIPCSVLVGLSMIGACWLPTDLARATLGPAETLHRHGVGRDHGGDHLYRLHSAFLGIVMDPRGPADRPQSASGRIGCAQPARGRTGRLNALSRRRV